MQHADQIAMIHRLFKHIDQKTTTCLPTVHQNSVNNYICPERLTREIGELFRKGPVFLGLSGRIPEPGGFATEDVAGVPVLYCRDMDGKARAYLNICRHRGARLVEGCGHARRFTCPYHAWTYRLDGGLQTVPSGKDFPEIVKGGNGLHEISCVEEHGLIFVQIDGTIDRNALWGGLDRDFASYGFGSFHHYRSLTIRRQMNWKLCPETFMEGYHLQYLHRDSVGPIFFSNLMAFDAFGHNSRLTLPRRRILELRERPESDWRLIPETAMIYNIFPNVTFVIQAGHVEMWRAYPDGGPDRCRVEVSVFTPEPVVDEKARTYYERNIDLAISTVDGEDFPLSEGIQVGHMAAMQDHVTYGRNEPALTHYSQSLDAALA